MTIRKTPKTTFTDGFSLKTFRSACSLMALLANLVFAMPLANFLIMFNTQIPSEESYNESFFRTADLLNLMHGVSEGFRLDSCAETRISWKRFDET